MGVSEDIAIHIQNASLGTPGTDLFSSIEMDTPDNQVVIYEYPGGLPVETMGVARKPQVSRPRIQIVCRGTSWDVASAKADAVWNLLSAVLDQTINGVRYLKITALQKPFLLKRDEKQRVSIACNYECDREEA